MKARSRWWACGRAQHCMEIAAPASLALIYSWMRSVRIFTFLNFAPSRAFVQTGKPALKSRRGRTGQPRFVLLVLPASGAAPPSQKVRGALGGRSQNLSSPNSVSHEGSCISGGEAGTAGAEERPNEMMPLGLFHLPVEREPRAVPLSVKSSCVGLLHHHRAGAANMRQSWSASLPGQDKMSQGRAAGDVQP